MAGKSIIKKVFALTALALLLCGCTEPGPAPAEPELRWVTQVTVTREDAPEGLQRRYTSENKIRAVLNYLRRLDARLPAKEDPGIADGPCYRITVRRSDGTETVYRQKGRGRLFTPTGWKKIDPKLGRELEFLLRLIPGDPEDAPYP